jgi:hypothetical protein
VIRRLLVGPLVCLGIALAAYGGFLVYRSRTGTAKATPGPGVLRVEEAVLAPVDSKVAVIGYVFTDRFTGDLLCSERTKGSRPACKGTAASLQQLDPTRLALEHAKVEKGGFDAWTPDPVVLQVRARRATLIVQDVLPTP